MHSTDGVVVEGIDNCPIKFAKCCSPLPGDEIIGFVTRGFGVVHPKRGLCQRAGEHTPGREHRPLGERLLGRRCSRKTAKLRWIFCAWTARNLLSDVALALGDMRVPIYSLTARSAEQGRARMSVTVGITNTEHLNSVVARLKKVKDVVSVNRN